MASNYQLYRQALANRTVLQHRQAPGPGAAGVAAGAGVGAIGPLGALGAPGTLPPLAESAAETNPGDPYEGLGGALQLAGMAQAAIGAFAQAENQQHIAKSQALSLEFERSMSAINARNAEIEADSIMEAGEQEIANVTAQYGQAKAANKASTAAAGIKGTGSAAETQASIEYAKRVDAYTINVNRVRQAEAAKMRGVDASNRGLVAGVSAQNLRGYANSIQPGVAAVGSLIGSAGQVANYWAYTRRR